MGPGGGYASDVAVGGTARSAWASISKGSSSTWTTTGWAAAGSLTASKVFAVSAECWWHRTG